MKTRLFFLRFCFGALLLFSFNACEYFTLTDYSVIEPELDFYPPRPLGDDAVILRAEILDRGITGVEVVGFAYNYDGRRDIEENQIAGEISSDSILTFSTIVDGLVSGRTVYFYAFAGSEEGYNGIVGPQEYLVP